MPESKKLIVVLGAHRSGTSLCAAAVHALGAQMCTPLDYINEENRKGFFEHPDIVEFNDRLLQELGASWDNPLFQGSAALADVDIEPYHKEACAVVGEIFGGVELAAVKDPRMCQLLDFWIPVFLDVGYSRENIFYVHTLRNVVEVALSQRSRSEKNPAFYEIGKEPVEGAAIWLSLTAQVLSSGRDLPAWYVSYDKLVSEPSQVLGELADYLGVEPDAGAVTSFCTEFVDCKLYRSTMDESVQRQLEESLPQALEFGAALNPLLQNGPGAGDIVDEALQIFHRPDTQRALYQVMVPALSRLSAGSRRDRLQVELDLAEIDNLQNQLDELAKTNKLMKKEQSEVVIPLRSEIENLSSGLQSLQVQLAEQAREGEAQQATLQELAAENAELRIRENDLYKDNAYLQEQLSALRTEMEVRTTEHRAALEAFRDETEKLQAENLRVEGECAHLVEQRSELEHTIDAMQESLSWRLTRPIRAVRSRQIRLHQWATRQWAPFRVDAIQDYHRLSLKHPGTAWTLRRALRPVIRSLDRILGDATHAPLYLDSGEQLVYMKYQQAAAETNFKPLISVIIPNYNHAPYLSLRLDSVYSQTYQNFEVILLDDASSDTSTTILKDYSRRYKDKTTLVINEENSGSVFRQWQRGLALAQGDIVWIAESDDWCTENFLETLVPFFENEAVQLAYSRTAFMDRSGDQQVWSINEYLHDIDSQRWNQAFVETGPRIVAESFALKNIVPNVSSALFRNPRELELLQEPGWLQMQTCGDWILYLHLLRGGMLAYSPAACNYYRMHGGNTSVSSYSQDEYYKEHEEVAKTVQKYYQVSAEIFERLQENLGIHWRNTRKDYSHKAFEACFSLERIREVESQRAPNLLMASYAFCAGGGETFPVSLANIMKARGYNVTYLDCAQEPRNNGVRDRLRSDISIVSNFRHLELIVHDFNIDVIHSHHAWMDSTILDLLPEKNPPCKTVVTLHGMYETINEYDLKPIMPRLARRSACLIYVAEKNLAALRRHKLESSVSLARIDNALEEEPFEPVLREDLGIAEDAFVLTLVSRGMVEKGWVEAIEAVAQARTMCDRDIQLLLVGDGPEYIRMLGIELPDFVHLEGFQSNVRGYFAVADVGFLPSKFRGESFPLVIIECLQAGRPFLASDLGEISHMLEGSGGMAGAVVGMLGDEVDVSGMAAQISRIATDDALYQSALSQVPKAVTKFDLALLAQKHDEVYRAAVAED